MLKTLALSASVLAFAGGLAVAETPMTNEASTGRHWLASDIYKADVYDPSENKIGDVADLVIDSNGNVTGAIIGISGSLPRPAPSAGQRLSAGDVVIPFKELKISTHNGKDWLVLNRTKDDLKMAPAADKKAEASLSTAHFASGIYKANVYDPSEHKIGDVTDLVIDGNANVTAAIIGVGGFIGIGQKDVMIPFNELKISTRDGKDWLVLNRTKDDLKMAPAVDKKSEGKM